MRHRHRPGPEGSSLGAAVRRRECRAIRWGHRGGKPGSLLCGDIRTEQGASIVRRHGRHTAAESRAARRVPELGNTTTSLEGRYAQRVSLHVRR
jgi:hypothetical protein